MCIKILNLYFIFIVLFIFFIFSIMINVQIIKNPPSLNLFFNQSLLIYRAVEDKRYNIIRILGAMYLNLNISDIIIAVNGKIIKYKIRVLGLLIKFNYDFPLKYVNFVFNSTYVRNITVNNRIINYDEVKQINYKYDFTVCINAIKNRYSAATIVRQTLDIYKKEGVSHCIVYYGDISNKVLNVLYEYVKIGFLDIYYWPELEILSYIRNYGQILKMNDCLYRSYYNSRYIINTDIDEIIMPKKFYTLRELINHYSNKNPNCGIFHFYSKTFPSSNKSDNIFKLKRDVYRRLPLVEDVDLYSKILSCKETMLRTKYIISTLKVECLRFHNAVTSDKHCRIAIEDGHCRHTRMLPHDNLELCNNMTNDHTILKYKI